MPCGRSCACPGLRPGRSPPFRGHRGDQLHLQARRQDAEGPQPDPAALSLEAADELSARLEAIGNIHSDGRPILGLDSRDLLELTLEACPEAEFIPAHIWTPHFAMFGAFSGFDTIEECFGDLTAHIHAVETGLSSDPPMNWRLSALDRLHPGVQLRRPLPRQAGPGGQPAGHRAVLPGAGAAPSAPGRGLAGTMEFFPEEGKYHLDGHRNCGVCLTPAETAAAGRRCARCAGKS